MPSVAFAEFTKYSNPGIDNPWGLTAGPDGEQAVWFVNAGDYDVGDGSIGRSTAEGEVTIYTDPRITEPLYITPGPNGEHALWFTDRRSDSIGRISTTGEITTYTDPCISYPEGIVAGPDGALWFTDFASNYTPGKLSNYNAGHSIGRITTEGVVTCYTDPNINYPSLITVGPDGALWFTDFGSPEPCPGPPYGCAGTTIGRITTEGIVTSYSEGANIHGPIGIATGPDSALWYTNNVSPTSIGRLTTEGVTTSYPGEAYGISEGLEGENALWFTEYYNGAIGRIATSGERESYAEAAIERPRVITPGPDGAMWFTSVEGVGNASNAFGGPFRTFSHEAEPGGVHWIGRITAATFSLPRVTGLSPESGPDEGGTSVKITGSKLTGATAVEFGDNPAPSFTVNSSTSITATAPPGTGTVHLTVTTPAGTSPAGPGYEYTHVSGAPTCTHNSGTVKLAPGLTDTPTTQTLKVKGSLSGCTGEPFAAAAYNATLKTAGPVSCSVLTAAGETASGAAKYKWTPKAKASTGTVRMPLTETPGVAFSGEVANGSYAPAMFSGTVSQRYTGATTCSTKAVKKGTFTGSAVSFE